MQPEAVLSTEKIRLYAARLGFDACGVCPAAPLERRAAELIDKCVEEGRNAEMGYLARNRELRLDPAKLVPGTKSIVSVALNYYPGEKMDEGGYTLSYHAYGKDYHAVVKSKLRELFGLIRESLGAAGEGLSGRAFCDTAPVAERYWAWRAGIGFTGKNTLLIIPGKGSYFFLGELFLNAPADVYGEPLEERCGGCERCLEACPTCALCAPGLLDARRCLSYLTIESRGSLPSGAAKAMQSCVYGCDCCQRACPHNGSARPAGTGCFRPDGRLLAMTDSEWENLTEARYRELFRGSSVKRAGYAGLMRNIRAAEKERRNAAPKAGAERRGGGKNAAEPAAPRNRRDEI